MTRITPIRTGSVRVRTAQRQRKPGGLPRVLIDRKWTEWLPIYAWVIEHPAGIFVVDTGESAKTSDPGYFPRWHPYYRLGCEMKVAPAEEIGPQLREMGIGAGDVRAVVMTHLHTDHAGGLGHFSGVPIYVDMHEHRSASGLMGRLRGYLPNRWPVWFEPVAIPMDDGPLGPFGRSFKLTADGAINVVPTPGHTPNHVSVVVRTDEVDFFIAGDTSYSEALLKARKPDGVSPAPKQAVQTIDNILAYARTRPLVYLPSHDPESQQRVTTVSTVLAEKAVA